MEARGELPPRVSFSAKVFGWRLADMEALVRDRMSTSTPRRGDRGMTYRSDTEAEHLAPPETRPPPRMQPGQGQTIFRARTTRGTMRHTTMNPKRKSTAPTTGKTLIDRGGRGHHPGGGL